MGKIKTLITGGAGFIGSNLANYLLEKTDWKLTVLDNLSNSNLENLKGIENYEQSRVEFVEADIRDRETVVDCVRGKDFVVNLAAQVGVVDSQQDPFHDMKVNVEGLLNLLEASRKNKVKKVIHASSAAPLGNQEPPINEEKVPQPLAPYGASKLAGEGYCSAYFGSFDLNTTVLRFSNVYGPYSFHKSSVIHLFIKQILQGEQLTIYGDGEQTRDFVYAKDIAQAVELALMDESDGFDLYQVGTGNETSVNELFGLLKEKMEQRGYQVENPSHEEERSGEIKRNYADISKIKNELGFSPSFDLTSGLEETIDYFLSES